MPIEKWMLDFGLAGILVLFLGREFFAYLGKSKTSDALILAEERFNSIRTASEAVYQKLVESLKEVVGNNTSALHRIDTILELVQERNRMHEESATRRHTEVMGISKDRRESCKEEHSYLEDRYAKLINDAIEKLETQHKNYVIKIEQLLSSLTK